MDETKKIIVAVVLMLLIFGSATFLGGWKLGVMQAEKYWQDTVKYMDDNCLLKRDNNINAIPKPVNYSQYDWVFKE